MSDDFESSVERIGGAARNFRAGAQIGAIIPTTLSEVALIADAFIKAGMAPDSYTVEPKDVAARLNLPIDSREALDEANRATQSRIILGIMTGAEKRMPPVFALSTIAIINGRPCVYGDGAQGLILQSHYLYDFEEIWDGPEEIISSPVQQYDGEMDHTPSPRDFPPELSCTFRLYRNGIKSPFEGRFSVRDAMRARLWNNTKRDPWIKYPKRMLMIRARAFPQRDGFADVLGGLAIREELEDTMAIQDNRPSFVDYGLTKKAPQQQEQHALAAPTETPMADALEDQGQTVDRIGKELRASRSAPFGVMPRDANPLPLSGGSSTSTAAHTGSSPTPPRDTGDVKHRNRPSYKDYADRIMEHLEKTAPDHSTLQALSGLLGVSLRTIEGSIKLLGDRVECSQHGIVRLMRREAVVPSLSEKEEPVTGLTQPPRAVDDESHETADDAMDVGEATTEDWQAENAFMAQSGNDALEEAAEHDGGYDAKESSPIHAETLVKSEDSGGSPVPPKEISENVKSWWRMAEQDNAFMLRIDDRYPMTTYKEFLIDLAEGAPNAYRLERFATANTRNIDAVQENLGLEAAQQVRDVIDRMRRELNPRR